MNNDVIDKYPAIEKALTMMRNRLNISDRPECNNQNTTLDSLGFVSIAKSPIDFCLDTTNDPILPIITMKSYKIESPKPKLTLEKRRFFIDLAKRKTSKIFEEKNELKSNKVVTNDQVFKKSFSNRQIIIKTFLKWVKYVEERKKAICYRKKRIISLKKDGYNCRFSSVKIKKCISRLGKMKLSDQYYNWNLKRKTLVAFLSYSFSPYPHPSLHPVEFALLNDTEHSE